MASGHTPALTCELLAAELKNRQIDYSQLRFFGLDEWAGLAPEAKGSCARDFMERLIMPLGLQPEQYFLFNALAANLEEECRLMDRRIEAHGGLDIVLAGIGMNGHVGFNEPGTPFTHLCHVAQLEAVTTAVGVKYFDAGTAVPQQGITIGPAHLLSAGTFIIMANGEEKADVVRQAVTGAVDPAFPATMVQLHKNGFMLIDEAAGALLEEGNVMRG